VPPRLQQGGQFGRIVRTHGGFFRFDWRGWKLTLSWPGRQSGRPPRRCSGAVGAPTFVHCGANHRHFCHPAANRPAAWAAL
jgi:hypothetical protein